MAKALLLSCIVLALSAVDCLAADAQVTIAEFASSVCEPCKRMQPVISKLTREGWNIRQFDVAEEAALVERFQVKSVPTIVILRDGQEVDRIVGALGYEKLRARFERARGTQSFAASAANDLALAQPQPARRADPQPPRRSAAPTPRSSSSSAATVRGQSPAIAAFPLLSAGAFGSLTPSATQTAPSAASPSVSFASGANSAGNAAAANVLASNSASANTREMTEAPAGLMQPLNPQQSQPTARRSNAPPSAEALATAAAATVRIRIDEANAVSFGTGTVINVHGEQALVLTCGHLFRDMKPDSKLSVDVYHNGRPITVPATLVAFNAKEYDLGMVEFRVPLPIVPVRVAPLVEHPQVGDVAFSFGCDRGADPTRRDTQIKRINRYLGAANVEIHGAPVVGRSGGGLFDAQGRLVGVCNAADEEDDEGIYAALPIVHEHIASLNLQELNPAANAAALATTPAAPPVAFAQLASTSSGASTPATVQPMPADSKAASPGYWPDQNQIDSRLASAAAPAQVRCIIRDAAGRESTIVIDHASEELLAALRQHALR